MARLLFEKTGNAIWISHLDLMRLFQRAFQRAGFRLKHSQGFNPRPMVSIALPMSVGVESCCEVLDFDLEDQEELQYEELCAGLNAALVSGVQVLSVYEPVRKVKEISHIRCQIHLEYDRGVDAVGVQTVADLFRQEQLLVEKKGKNGPTQLDIIPLLSNVQVTCTDGHNLILDAIVCAQNPALNPMLLAAAVEKYLPDLRPDFSKCKRIEIYDSNGNVFR